MTNTTLMMAADNNDAELVARTLAGDRDAFGHIVARYQILVCSLAYSRIGNLGQSEDVAQETFIIAWKRLRLLRDHSKLRAWLCGIVRNRSNKCLERERREPAQQAEPLEAVDERAEAAALPSDQAIGREEEAILWRSLERMPEIYREPLILFYREHESIATVAEQLELSEDAVKQRLARGRKLLQEEVAAMVENTLRRSSPGKTFSSAVLAGLPLAGPSAAGMDAGKGAAAKSGGLLGAWLMPVVGILGAIAAHWTVFRAAPSAEERRLKKGMFTALWAFVLGWALGGQVVMQVLAKNQGWSEETFFSVMTVFWWLYAMVISTCLVVLFRRMAAIRRNNEQLAATGTAAPRTWNPRRRIAILAGMYFGSFWWLIGIAWQAHDVASAVICTIAMLGLAVSQFLQFRKPGGAATVRTIAGHVAATWAFILVILNLRLEQWMTMLHNLSLDNMHHIWPTTLMPTLSGALLLWVGLLFILTKTKRQE